MCVVSQGLIKSIVLSENYKSAIDYACVNYGVDQLLVQKSTKKVEHHAFTLSTD